MTVALQTVIFSKTFNTLRSRQNGRHFPGDIFKDIFFNESCFILIKISLKDVPLGLFNDIPLVGWDNGLALVRWQAIMQESNPKEYRLLNSINTLRTVVDNKAKWNKTKLWLYQRFISWYVCGVFMIACQRMFLYTWENRTWPSLYLLMPWHLMVLGHQQEQWWQQSQTCMI